MLFYYISINISSCWVHHNRISSHTHHRKRTKPASNCLYIPKDQKNPLSVPSIHILTIYTGNSAFLLCPAKAFKACWIYGPMTGTPPTNCPIVTKKSPNSIRIPYNSTQKPIKGHRKRMRRIPPANAAVPLSFAGREKKAIVF